MKRVVSVSLGSSKRDHRVETYFGDQLFSIERVGTDGSMEKAKEWIARLDGEVDAIGLGGIDLYLQAGERRYVIREAQQLARMAKKTPVVDGNGLKNTLERRVVETVAQCSLIRPEQKVLMVCALDRFGMARALEEQGCQITCGDFLFSFGIGLPIYKLSTLDRLARWLAPLVCQLPFQMLYPTGAKQESGDIRFSRFFDQSHVIAGDFHFIRRFMPASLEGKIIITNTVTAEDLTLLRDRGVQCLITTTPDLGGRSFGTNVLEGVLVALAGKRPEQMHAQEYSRWLEKLNWPIRIEQLQDHGQTNDLSLSGSESASSLEHGGNPLRDPSLSRLGNPLLEGIV